MYVSILTGHVGKENWEVLEKSYTAALRHPPDGLQESYLIHCSHEPSIWQIISIWSSQDTFERCKQMLITDICSQLFCDAGSLPDRKTFQVTRRYVRV